jgi:uncharacterized protein
MRTFLSLLVGLLFGTGLCVSHMTDPEKVLGFLDLAGKWDPSLLFVIGGALIVAFPAFRFAKKREQDLLGSPLKLPGRVALDPPLVFGSVAFGIGWGLAGICPGPGIVDVGFAEPGALVFVTAMAAGMISYASLDFDARATPRLVDQDS